MLLYLCVGGSFLVLGFAAVLKFEIHKAYYGYQDDENKHDDCFHSVCVRECVCLFVGGLIVGSVILNQP